jgi:LemA protein
MQRLLRPLLVCCLMFLGGCGYNAIESASQEVEAAWEDMLAQYEYRDGMVSSLVATLARYVPDQPSLTQRVRVAHEQTRNIEDPVDPPTEADTLRDFQERQAALSAALISLMEAAESHPLLVKGDALDALQRQVDDSQNRITAAQARYIRAVGAYNNKIKRFPANLTARFMGMDVLPNMSIRQEARDTLVRPPQFDVRPVQRVPGKDGNALMPALNFAS